mgnify:CR=1 FL=1
MKLKHAGLAILISFCLIVGMITPLSAATAETPSIEDSTLNWSQFLGNEGLQGISDAKTPTSGDNMELLWQAGKGSHTSGNMGFNEVPGTPIVVGDYVYVYYSEELHKLDLETGEEVASAPVFGKSTNQFFIYIAYGDGKIFVPCDSNTIDAEETGVSKNHIRVYDAETLEQLYITEEIGDSGMQTPIFYHDGYIFTGGYFRNNYYACFDVTDDNPDSDNEVKEAEWKVQTTSTKGFCWNGAAFVGDYCIFADSGYRTGSTVWSVNYKTGEVVDTFTMSGYECNASIVYYEKNNRVYISANHPDDCASIISYEVLPNGELDQDSKMEWASGVEYGGTQSTPVIYNDRLYVIGGGGHGGSGAPFRVMDANTLEIIYEYEELNAKGSIVLTTAYATKENKQTVYLYAMAYQNPKHVENNQNVFDEMNVYVFQDYEGLDHAICEKVDLIELGIVEPTQGQYISQTFSIDQFGNLSMYWDSNYVICIGNKKDTAITGDDVKQQIDRMPEVNEYKYYNNFELRRIRERYDNLSDDEKAKVTNLDKLTAMLEASEKLPEERLDELMDAIAALPAGDELTLDNAETVENLYSLYSQMTDKTLVENGAVLEAAYAKIQQLRGEDAAAKLVADIAALPAADKLTLADEGTVAGLEYRLEALGEDYAAKVTNADVLEAARTRINAIHAALESLDTLLAAKLNGPITLESKALIDEAIQAMEGLDPADIATLTSYEQYFVPATVDYVNLLLDSLFTEDALTPVTQDNVATLKDTLAQIETYYAYIPEADQKYVTKADAAAEMQAAIDAFEQGTDTPDTPETPDTTQKPDSPDTPDTGDAFPWLAVTLLGMALITGMVCSRRFQKHA